MAAFGSNDDYRSELEEDLEPAAPPAPHVIEKELTLPAPRTVEAKTSAQVTRWILIALLIVLPAICFFFADRNQRDWLAVRDHGVDAVATLTHKTARRRGKRAHGPSGTYSYVVGDTAYSIKESYTDAEYAAAREGVTTTMVRYLPEDPGTAYLRRQIETGGETNTTAIVCWCLAGLSVLVVGGIWFNTERIRSRRRFLAAEGVAVPTNSLDMTKVSHKSNDNNWRLTYTYALDGKAYDGSATFPLPTVQEMLAGGNTATVLVDPGQPSRHELYAAVKRTIEVVPASGGFGSRLTTD